MIFRKFFLLLLSCFLMVSCGDDALAEESVDNAPRWPIAYTGVVPDCLKGDKLRVLDIGNSFTQDATALLAGLVENSGSDVSEMCLYTLVRGGASWRTWANCWYGKDNASYSYNKVFGGLDQSVEGSGSLVDGKANPELMQNVLTKVQWDLIVIHQVSHWSGEFARWNEDNSAGGLDELLEVIQTHQPDAKLAFLLVHAPNGQCIQKKLTTRQRWEQIVNSAKLMQEHYGVELVIPYGTAVENLRLTEYNDSTNMCRDNLHLARGLARYTAAAAYYESLVAPWTGIDIEGNKYRYACTQDDWNLSTKSKPIDVTDKNVGVAWEAALEACRNWDALIGDSVTVVSPETGTN